MNARNSQQNNQVSVDWMATMAGEGDSGGVGCQVIMMAMWQCWLVSIKCDGNISVLSLDCELPWSSALVASVTS